MDVMMRDKCVQYVTSTHIQATLDNQIKKDRP